MSSLQLGFDSVDTLIEVVHEVLLVFISVSLLTEAARVLFLALLQRPAHHHRMVAFSFGAGGNNVLVVRRRPLSSSWGLVWFGGRLWTFPAAKLHCVRGKPVRHGAGEDWLVA